ncbi:MAG: tyrosine-type recombinase/integrase [Deltaproteobacteria bacterium]|nr:tyrosine-type recombinase/integrase [Deltaproteobacteria bacterium]
MTPKFNTKEYKGKARIYSPVPKAPRVSRLWNWDEAKREYRIPVGNTYYAAKYQINRSGNRKRSYQSFPTLEEARNWQNDNTVGTNEIVSTGLVAITTPIDVGPMFRDILNEWRRRRFPHMAYSTQVQYDKVLRLHFHSLIGLPVRAITPQRIDLWMDELKAEMDASTKRLTRLSFDHELSLLSTILSYYQNYYDDSLFQFPIKQRHKDACRLNRRKANTPKDLSEEEFLKFRTELLARKNGRALAVMATVQYFQALRISEAAGLYWEDIHFDWTSPCNSRIKIVRSVCYPHRGNEEAFVKGGFKNSGSNSGVKEQPMFPEVFEALKSLYTDGCSGLIFGRNEKPLPYRVIQCHYNRSFKKAGLPYTGTHVMRHGGCRRVFNENGELNIAQQLLGNSDLKTTLVYAKRQASALTKVVHGYWEKKASLLAGACSEVSKN